MTIRCSVENCENAIRKRGMCDTHYARWWRTGTPNLQEKKQVKCSVDGCEEITTSKTGMCMPHYKQSWYLKSVGREELLERTSQGYWINSTTGYIVIKVDGKLVYEHRHLAEKALGKPLPDGAVVHHMRKRHENTEPFSLVICPSQEYHMLLHKRMEELGYACD